MAFIRVAIIATVLAIMAAIGVRTADAAFSATTTSAGNTWTASASSYLTSADFTTVYTAGSGNGSASWSGSTVNLSKIVSILSNGSQANVTFNVTGSMPTSATQRGYSLWTRTSVTGSGSTTKVTGYEFRLDVQAGRYVFTWWNNGVERSSALATANFPSGFNPKASHAISLTLYGRSVEATVDGSVVLRYTLPTSPASFNGSNVALPSGGRYGLRTWTSGSVVSATLMTAYASTAIAGMAMSLMALDCLPTDATLTSPASADSALATPTIDPTPSDLASESAVATQPSDPAADLLKDVSATDKAVVAVDSSQPTVTPTADASPDPASSESASPEPTTSDVPVDPPAEAPADLGLALADPCPGVLLAAAPAVEGLILSPSPDATPTDAASPTPSAVPSSTTPQTAASSEMPTATPVPVETIDPQAPADQVSPAASPDPGQPSNGAVSGDAPAQPDLAPPVDSESGSS
jgi:hypothetical protein